MSVRCRRDPHVVLPRAAGVVDVGRQRKQLSKPGVKMSTTANTDGLEEKGETRVMGIGVGVFLIFFFAMVAAVVCLVGATTPRPG